MIPNIRTDENEDDDSAYTRPQRFWFGKVLRIKGPTENDVQCSELTDQMALTSMTFSCVSANYHIALRYFLYLTMFGRKK